MSLTGFVRALVGMINLQKKCSYRHSLKLSAEIDIFMQPKAQNDVYFALTDEIRLITAVSLHIHNPRGPPEATAPVTTPTAAENGDPPGDPRFHHGCRAGTLGPPGALPLPGDRCNGPRRTPNRELHPQKYF